MGQQDGIIKLKGQVGDFTFYKTKDGSYQARKKGGVSGKRILEDPAYVRTRENMEEFTRANRGSKVMRNALRALVISLGDNRVSNRLTRELMKVLQSDTVSNRGKRTVTKGSLALLTGFEFNVASPFDTTFLADYTPAIDRATGIMKVDVPAFIPETDVQAAQGATHVRFVMVGAGIDFEAGAHESVKAQSEMLVLDGAGKEVQPLSITLTAGTQQPLFLVLGIEFHQFVNGSMYPLKSGAFNALKLVKVDQLPG